MAGDNGGGDAASCDIVPVTIIIYISPVATIIILSWTSEIGAAHLMVSLTMTDAPTHGLPGHRCTLSVSVSATILSSNNTFMLSNSNNKQHSATLW